MKVIATGLALLLACTASRANDLYGESVFLHPMTPQQLRQLTVAAGDTLAGALVVRGQFVQRRYVRGLPQALESQGEFLFAQGVGIEWRTRTPVESQITITPTGIGQGQGSGPSPRPSGLPPAALPVVARIFFGLFALDFDALARDFSTFGEADGDRWRIGLQARRATLARAFKRVVLAGRSAADTIVLYDAAGGKTEILLRQLQFDARPLPVAERARF